MTDTKPDSPRRVFGLDSDTLISRLEKKRIRIVVMNLSLIHISEPTRPY